MTLGWAIIGTGRFASGRVAPALNRAHGCKLVAVVSRERDRASRFAEEFGIPRAYDDLSAALADPAVDAIWVTTPHSVHHEAVIAAAKARRHILCEKPLATTLADAKAMVRDCDQAGVALGTGFHLRHHPLHREVRRLIQAGNTGSVLAAEAEWSEPARAPAVMAPWRFDADVSGGGILTGTGIHALDLLRFVLDDEVESVAASLDRLPEGGAVESAATCMLRFRGGVTGVIRCLRSVFDPANDLIVECSSASIRLRGSLDEQARGSAEIRGVSESLDGVPVGADLYALQAEAFQRSVAAGVRPDASGEDGLRVTAAALAIYRAAATGRWVDVEAIG